MSPKNREAPTSPSPAGRGVVTEEQRAVLRQVSRTRVVERLAALIGDGRLSVSQVQRRYGALIGHVGQS